MKKQFEMFKKKKITKGAFLKKISNFPTHLQPFTLLCKYLQLTEHLPTLHLHSFTIQQPPTQLMPRPSAQTKYFCPGQYLHCPGQKFCPGIKSLFFV